MGLCQKYIELTYQLLKGILHHGLTGKLRKWEKENSSFPLQQVFSNS